jgi:hypothetical protein
LGLGNRRFFGSAEQDHTRIVDEHIDALGLGDDGLDAMLNGRFITDIHLDERNPRYGLCLCRVAHGAEDPATLLCEFDGGGAADALRHASNEDSFGVLHGGSFPV